MMPLRSPSVLAWSGLMLLAGCTSDATGPMAGLESEAFAHGLAVALTVDPAAVGENEGFDVELSVTNTRSEPVALTTLSSCLAIPGVYRNGKRMPFDGSWWGCWAAISTHVLAPGETVTRTWGMRARLYAERPGDPDGVGAPPGPYEVRVEFEVFQIDGQPAVLPDLTEALLVR
jgi:hypothetical protein